MLWYIIYITVGWIKGLDQGLKGRIILLALLFLPIVDSDIEVHKTSGSIPTIRVWGLAEHQKIHNGVIHLQHDDRLSVHDGECRPLAGLVIGQPPRKYDERFTAEGRMSLGLFI